jgi:membrane protease YdiL (CAAX protease family)
MSLAPTSPDPLSPRRMVRLAVVFEGSLIVLACALGWFVEPPPWQQIHGRLDSLMAGVLGTVPLLAALALTRFADSGPLGRLNRVVNHLLVPLFRRCTLAQLALVSLLAGVGEELLFRGVFQPVLSDWLGVPGGLAVTSVLFGVAHLVTPTYAVLTTLVGVYLGSLWLLTGDLAAPIITHALYDFAALVYLTRWEGRRQPAG